MRILLMLSIFVLGLSAQAKLFCKTDAYIFIKAEVVEELPVGMNENTQWVYQDKETKFLSGTIEFETLNREGKVLREKQTLESKQISDLKNNDEENHLNVIDLKASKMLVNKSQIKIAKKEEDDQKIVMILNMKDLNKFLMSERPSIDGAKVCGIEKSETTLTYDKEKNVLTTNQSIKMKISMGEEASQN